MGAWCGSVTTARPQPARLRACRGAAPRGRFPQRLRRWRLCRSDARRPARSQPSASTQRAGADGNGARAGPALGVEGDPRSAPVREPAVGARAGRTAGRADMVPLHAGVMDLGPPSAPGCSRPAAAVRSSSCRAQQNGRTAPCRQRAHARAPVRPSHVLIALAGQAVLLQTAPADDLGLIDVPAGVPIEASSLLRRARALVLDPVAGGPGSATHSLTILRCDRTWWPPGRPRSARAYPHAPGRAGPMISRLPLSASRAVRELSATPCAEPPKARGCNRGLTTPGRPRSALRTFRRENQRCIGRNDLQPARGP